MAHTSISTDPAVMMGKPCIKGTRITVELVLRKLGAGRSIADVIESYPQLTEDDVRAALAFTADFMQHETVMAVSDRRPTPGALRGEIDKAAASLDAGLGKVSSVEDFLRQKGR